MQNEVGCTIYGIAGQARNDDLVEDLGRRFRTHAF